MLIGTPKAINFPFVSNEKLMFFRCPSIQAHCNEAVIYLNFGTPKNNNFPFGTNGKFIILGVPILKHIRVSKTYISRTSEYEYTPSQDARVVDNH